MTINPIVWYKKKKLHERMTTMLEVDRATIRKAINKVVMSSRMATPQEILALPAPKAVYRRVDILGADEIYEAINKLNYKGLADSILMAQAEEEILVAMCVIDKCEDYEDFETMIEAYKRLDTILRYTKDENPTLSYARRFRNRISEHMMSRGIY